MVRPGRYVMLAVSDTGSGMEAEVRERLFEPFFTTKQLGRGTGLGLATVYGIVKQSDGYIFVYSEVGRGTTFKVYLPRVDEPLAAEDASPAPLARGSETVLLVEDDPSLWELTKELLEASGYRVLAAADGAAALELSRGHKGVIDLLLTDVVMPGLTGRQLAEQLERERAGIAILYTSGYTDNVVARQGLLDSETALLPKPFTADALARKVREVLDTRPRP